MPNKIQIRRGDQADLPLLDSGEFGFAVDTERLYVGNPLGSGNILMSIGPQGFDLGNGADGYAAFFTGPNALAGDNDFFWDRANNRLGIRTDTPTHALTVDGYITPATDNFHALGTPDQRWEALWLGPSSLHIHSIAAETGISFDWRIGIDQTTGNEGNLIFVQGEQKLLILDPVANTVTFPIDELEIGGNIKLPEGSAPLDEVGFGKLYISSSDNNLHFLNSSGLDIAVGDTSGIDGTVQEHYNQHSNAIQTILKDLDGYAYLPGRSGGQTLIGGTGAGDDLTLTSTSNGTKGDVVLGTNIVVDQVNSFVGIGTATPGVQLHVDIGGGTMPTFNGSDKLVLGSTSNAAGWSSMVILAGNTTGRSIINFGDRDDSDPGQIYYDHATNYMGIKVNTGERLTISPNGVTIPAPAATGHGLTVTGTGTGSAIQATGGATNGNGVVGYGVGTGAGVYGVTVLATGHAVIAWADEVSPAKAALRIVPQNADPATAPASGDTYVHSSTGKLRIHDGVNWNRYAAQCYRATASISTTTAPSTLATNQYTIPANALQAGSVIRFSAFGIYTGTAGAAGTNTLRFRLNTTSFALLSFSAAVGVRYWHFEGEIIVRGTGAAAALAYYSKMEYHDAINAAPIYEYFYNYDTNTLDTTSNQVCGLYVQGLGSNTTFENYSLIIDIS